MGGWFSGPIRWVFGRLGAFQAAPQAAPPIINVSLDFDYTRSTTLDFTHVRSCELEFDHVRTCTLDY